MPRSNQKIAVGGMGLRDRPAIIAIILFAEFWR